MRVQLVKQQREKKTLSPWSDAAAHQKKEWSELKNQMSVKTWSGKTWDAGILLKMAKEQCERLASGAVSIRKVSALAHEAGDDTVEARALVAVILALLHRAELTEVLRRLGRAKT